MPFAPVGAKTHKTSELVRVVEKSGKSYTVKGEVGLSGLSPESRLYVELSDEGHSICLALEAAITAEEQRSTKNVPFFPITIGRWENAVTDNLFTPLLYLTNVFFFHVPLQETCQSHLPVPAITIAAS